MSKLANPWKCDAPGCGILRANDTNHWLVIYVSRTLRHPDGGSPTVCAEPWDDEQADVEGTKHACGVPCGLKIAAELIVENFFPGESSPAGSEAQRGA